ncbi:EthD family reductase [Bordetella genomosp. 12]|uniref:EthD family reductase n=1 Tax=Bordetella genomosp. 12 TaxID=463035 RepID=UPI001FC96D6A|nr:EthD family reductase [Bordetella genomosp. 12]
MAHTQYIKRIGLLKRRPDMTMEAFHAHWLDVHAALCLKLPGLEKYAVNFVVRDADDPLGFDGFSELWFKDEAALQAAFDSTEGTSLLADLPNFMSEIRPLVVIEHRKK